MLNASVQGNFRDDLNTRVCGGRGTHNNDERSMEQQMQNLMMLVNNLAITVQQLVYALDPTNAYLRAPHPNARKEGGERGNRGRRVAYDDDGYYEGRGENFDDDYV